MRLGQIGLQRNGFQAVRQGFIGPAEIEQELAEVGTCLSERGVEGDGPPEVSERRVVFAEKAQGSAQVGVGGRVIGSQCQCRPKCVCRLSIQPQSTQGKSEVVVHAGIVQTERERGPTAVGRTVELAEGTIGLTQRGAEDGRSGAQRYGPGDQLGGEAGLTLLMAPPPAGEARLHGFDRGPESTRKDESPRPARRPGAAGPRT